MNFHRRIKDWLRISGCYLFLWSIVSRNPTRNLLWSLSPSLCSADFYPHPLSWYHLMVKRYFFWRFTNSLYCPNGAWTRHGIVRRNKVLCRGTCRSRTKNDHVSTFICLAVCRICWNTDTWFGFSCCRSDFPYELSILFTRSITANTCPSLLDISNLPI